MALDCSQHKMLPDRSAVATAASARAVSTPLPSLDRERAVLSDVTQDIRVRLGLMNQPATFRGARRCRKRKKREYKDEESWAFGAGRSHEKWTVYVVAEGRSWCATSATRCRSSASRQSTLNYAARQSST